MWEPASFASSARAAADSPAAFRYAQNVHVRCVKRTSRSQPPCPPGDGTPRALGGWLAGLGHNVTSDSGDDPVVTAWQWLAGHQAFEVGQAGARRVMRHLAGQDAAGT